MRVLLIALLCIIVLESSAQDLSAGIEVSAPDIFAQIEFAHYLGIHAISAFRHEGLINRFNFTGIGYQVSPWRVKPTHVGIGLRLGVYDFQFLGLQPNIYVRHQLGESRWIIKGEFSWRQGYPSGSVRLGYRLY